MRSQLFGLLVVFAIGCGGGGSSDKPDAPPMIDAAPDAPAAVTQLGKTCVTAMMGADCPSPATDGCLSVQGATMGFCTKLCVTNGTFMTNAQSQVTNLQPTDLTAQNQVCVTAYVGPTAAPSCTPGSGGVIINRMPTGALQPNTNYTYQIACGLGCSRAAPACPGGLTCALDPGGNMANDQNFCRP